ncbi:AP-4 complex subunit sigma [Trichoplax sp. H2]|nr:AP-4 complex subunit sigma [Trichoplax sp. H2]|eukprot:RDD39347.1 AP-4 complex subunit sigma [Trichoplax sp. H2]
MIKFILLVNKDGQSRLSRYYHNILGEERENLERETIQKCLPRSKKECSFLEYQNMMLIYRRYMSLFFIVGVDSDENELSILELIQNLVETFDRYFNDVITMNVEKAYMILDEMILNGHIIETSKNRILAPIYATENN